jgi:hypothetical protein
VPARLVLKVRSRKVKKAKTVLIDTKPQGKRPKLKTKSKPEPKGVSPTSPLADPGTSPSYKAYDVVVRQIEVVGKRRQINPEKVKELKESVAEIGLRTPITIRVVNGTKQLITGLHRLEAVKALGWKKIPAVKIKGGKKVARLWEIVAVGTAVASRPPHRSVRAQFGHTAPTLSI